jgi:hypothetical protein
MPNFIEPCESSGIDVNVVDSYCICALWEAMRRDPKPRNPIVLATDRRGCRDAHRRLSELSLGL